MFSWGTGLCVAAGWGVGSGSNGEDDDDDVGSSLALCGGVIMIKSSENGEELSEADLSNREGEKGEELWEGS